MLARRQTELAYAKLSQTPVSPPQPPQPTPAPSPGPTVPPPSGPSPGEITPGPGPDILPPQPVPADMPPPVASSVRTTLQLVMMTGFTLALCSGAAYAQPAAPPAGTAPPATSPTTPPEIVPGHPGGGRPNLSSNDGVIRPPPNVGDSGINQQAPAIGTMPVIPPPGTPGGNQAVQPK